LRQESNEEANVEEFIIVSPIEEFVVVAQTEEENDITQPKIQFQDGLIVVGGVAQKGKINFLSF